MLERYAPSINDVKNARRKLESSYGKVVYDRYLVNNTGLTKNENVSNKYYYLAICKGKDKYYAVTAWGRIGYWPHMGPNKSGYMLGESLNINTALGLVKEKEKSKLKRGYDFYNLKSAEGEIMNNMKTMAPVAVGTAVALLGYSLITGGNLLMEIWGGAKKTLGQAAENKRGCTTCKGSRKTLKSEYSVNQINPVEVEGAEDVYGAESVYPSPQSTPNMGIVPSLKLW